MIPATDLSDFGNLLLTRERGRSVATALPTHGDALRLDFGGVKAASPSFLDELARVLFERGVRTIVVIDATNHIVDNLERVGDQPARPGFPRASLELENA